MPTLPRLKPPLISIVSLLLLAAAPFAGSDAQTSPQNQARPSRTAPAAGSGASTSNGAAPAQGAPNGAAGNAGSAAGNAGSAPGQPPGAAAAPPPAPVVTLEDLRKLRSELRAGMERLAPLMKAIDTSATDAFLSASPLESLKQRAAQSGISDAERALWQQAVENEQAATERIRGARMRADTALGGKEALEDGQRTVEEMISTSSNSAAAEADVPLSRMQDDIAALNGRRAQAALELNQRRETLAQLEEQLRGQAETLDQLRRERDKQAAGTGAAQGDEPALADARRAVSDAVDRRTEARVLAAQLDSQTLPARIERLRLEIREREVETRWLGMRLAEQQSELGQRSTQELSGLTADLQRLIESGPDVANRFAAEIVALRGQIDDIARLQDRIRTLQQQREEHLRTEAELTQTLADVHERLEVGGLTETLGGLFLEEQRRLRDLGDQDNALRDLEREMAQSRLRRISEREQQRAAAPLETVSAAVDPALAELRDLQRKAADALERTEDSLTDQLRQTEVPLRSVAALVDQLDQILRETLLWWPSHPAVSMEWAKRVPDAVMALLDPRAWTTVRGALTEVSIGRPGASLLALLLVGFLYRAGRPAGRHLRALADKTRHRFTDSMKLTFKAMGWSLLRVLPGPVLLLAVAYRLMQIPDAPEAVTTLSRLFLNGAVWWLAGHLVVLFISRNGVGTVHFGWNPCIVQRLRRNLAWYLPVQFLLIIGLALAFGHPNDLVFDVFGRGALIASAVISGWLGWRVLAPDPALAPTLSERKRAILRFAVVLYALVLVGLALRGYLLTVGTLVGRTIDTFVVVVAVWLGYSLAARALILGEMRLRISRMLEQRAKAAQEGGGTGEGAVDPPEPHLSMEDVNHQTRTLVRVLAGAFTILALFWVWSAVLPALAWLDGVTLWSRTIMVGDTEISSNVSLQDLLLAAFLSGLFFVATRNLPGLVEIILARTTNVDAAGRYTASMLLRYGIIVAAVVTVFSLLGLRWGELQWMVAALSVGLGFGLQEVVANFVSGVIILFERPARVGDTITIGEYSGTVARIRTRATTIIDWDNREVVVPNKMFITDRLINWTLSDTVTRVVVRVGVSYGADAELVMRTLKEIALQHPSVMREPAPSVVFTDFGQSTLNFDLRVYVSQLRERLDTTSDLHREIVRVFRERGIEIAVPRMDLNVRALPPSLTQGSASAPPPARAPEGMPFGAG